METAGTFNEAREWFSALATILLTGIVLFLFLLIAAMIYDVLTEAFGNLELTAYVSTP
ncbi:hypothetical protein [Robertkochia aurantiaca]|uniref:hypothetical protein n=1 Tax=Robertkochia aurantiaca TaxID=2873700 RepID=UPI001CCDA6E1|nr:hypothetical protein [Robertkochia sp. 3YJGBD-33]